MVKIFVPHISTRLKKFFDYHKIVIDMMFKIIKLKKPHIINAYAYSIKNPPKNDNYKYTLSPRRRLSWRIATRSSKLQLKNYI